MPIRSSAATNKTPYSANFMFSIQRELAPNMVATASYVGTRGHNMLVLQQANPGDPALCLSVSQPSQVAPGSATCGPFGENGVYTTRGRQGDQRHAHDAGAELRNGHQAGHRSAIRATTPRAEPALHQGTGQRPGRLHATASRSTSSSNLGEQVNPFDVALSEAPSAFDMRHNFVVSYNYELPFARLFDTQQPAGDRMVDSRARRDSAADFRSRSTTRPTRRCSAPSATASTTTCSTRRTTRRAAI